MTEARPTVVLLHGLLRTARSMARLSRALEAEGYPVWARSYPSQQQPIEQSAREIADELREKFPGQRLAFVTHSLGGIIARFVAGPLGDGLAVDRIVMLAPPNRGSRIARRLGDLRVYQRLYGPAGQELRAEDTSAWPTPAVPIAVIAGTRPLGWNPVGWVTSAARIIRGDEPSDGTVLVDETHLPRMAAFATVDASHTFIMDHPEVHAMVLRFLVDGRLR